jgi:hypothetical protein
MKKYIWNLLVAVDRLGAAVLGWSGKITISEECAAKECGFCRFLCNVLQVLDKEHCDRYRK